MVENNLTYQLRVKTEDKNVIGWFMTQVPRLSMNEKADYELIVDSKHYIYKHQTNKNVYYVHYDPEAVKVFRICVYDKKEEN